MKGFFGLFFKLLLLFFCKGQSAGWMSAKPLDFHCTSYLTDIFDVSPCSAVKIAVYAHEIGGRAGARPSH